MEHSEGSSELLDLLNKAVARELQVSIQYMLQHGVEAGKVAAVSGKPRGARQSKFVASHSMVWLPGSTLKKIAIAEMRHAEAIVERVVVLGGRPTTEPAPVTIDGTVKDMLANDKEQERTAIHLYMHIIEVAEKHHDDDTRTLFERILADEKKHYRVFSELLGEVWPPQAQAL